MSDPRERRARLAASMVTNGIDFVEVVPDSGQRQLRVHFVNSVPVKAQVTGATITGGDTITAVDVHPLGPTSWTNEDGRPLLTLDVDAPGNFSPYLLQLPRGPALDRFFDHATFSFKVDCPSPFDCQPAPAACPPLADAAPTIDYLAKDFASFCQALSSFSALRYPAWQERSEPDFGVMFMEALASIADDLSYLQDRVAAEAWLDTATERRSLARLARLVDYEPGVPTAARVTLQLTVNTATALPAGVRVSARAPDKGTTEFEIGNGLIDKAQYTVRPSWNALTPHWWDESERCLPRGATSFWIVGWSHGFAPGQSLVIETAAASPGDPPVRQLVHLADDYDQASSQSTDVLYQDATGNVQPRQVTQLMLRPADELQVARDLASTVVAGNIVPGTQGSRHSETFTVRYDWSEPKGAETRAIIRTGPDATPQFLYTLRAAPLVWLPDPQGGPTPKPELVLTALDDQHTWGCIRSLLSADGLTEAVAVEPARYRLLDTRLGTAEYDGSDGDTLRFGDGLFGAVPRDGATFRVTYRTGAGAAGNVAADTINHVDPNDPNAAPIDGVNNPFAAEGGSDEELAERVRQMAPHAFRAQQFRAVRPADYDLAATRQLPWVQRAGTSYRYTGSWLTVFTAVDPRGEEVVAPDHLLDLAALFDRYRMAGYEAYGLPPRYAPVDLWITVCALPQAYRGDVERALFGALGTGTLTDGSPSFFNPDRYTFGDPLERSGLEAAIQDVPGVDGVLELQYRRRGRTAGFVLLPDAVAVGRDEILQLDNDPNHPERGSLRIDVRGGK